MAFVDGHLLHRPRDGLVDRSEIRMAFEGHGSLEIETILDDVALEISKPNLTAYGVEQGPDVF
ncbi:hypothetical protein D7B24_002531 [Verticillium nonalfalfae]|uniref:Uncharacterized protein n=1 Tax=Verticillium nonalfalfae TaxID=1051616 RepID=A0A3M9XYF0_9PEZI|nr:uncharacterized protein D7B24_002531 [Verticillium nonalfalfae]RNJ53024.1 hypothetical protein D7B24_002531 [Verticillium nonalfalfae]